MLKRRCYKVFKPGSLNSLKLREEELAAPAAGQATIAVKAIGLNYADIFAIMGLYSATPKEAFVPGLEFSGEVVATGAGVSRFKPGDAVFGVSRFGAYTTHLNLDERYLLPLPTGFTYNDAAAFPVQALTAYYALRPLGNLQQGQTVLIHSAAGGVGLLANRIAKKWNAYTIGVVGSSSKFETLAQEGYNSWLARSSRFPQELERVLAGRPLHLVLEATGGKYLKWSYEAMAPMGRLVAYGSARFTPSGSAPNWPRLAWQYLTRPKIDPMKMITENKSVMGFNLIWLYEQHDLFHQLMQELLELQLQPPHIGHYFSFNELPQALQLFRSGNTVGKVVIRVG
ncbi:zinc-binding dehydrogenase [Cesiribacter sp. SM1]|uniref:alcohol dehydrogenase catalytic domain-containing protein n=1 Tax=Cesiribacter sp. SM1 TaxID=2861196 RepID=UPI001CD3D846|nr:zinc-binding dehydrogenase [Cesiribacter sp. SM1]